MPRPIRFDAAGPEGWLQKEDERLETAELLQGIPMGQDFAFFSRPEAKLRAGIWRSSAYKESYDNYPADEFMIILDGEVTVSGDGFSETFRKGDAFLVPKGSRCVWDQPVAMRKFYVMVE
jgi:uncharacterized cupin superfamily protein